ncbi:MAG: AMP-binding protein [Pseudomonas sp.]|uniref:AMP-binding protein n=1 Tax=Pseudomonas abieticivorans TaxID=2931382 RepID=UPI0020C06934|nr:AMP-binding protein [Pseudomonas sp. PIA16]MDE1169479.1 AMP-binding protein [Pseudomonas sp.]
MVDSALSYTERYLREHRLENVFDLLDRAVAQHPERLAFSCGDQALTFRQLHQRADAFARYLRHGLGLQAGERLAVQLANGLEYPVAAFGALKAGIVLVNTNPHYTRTEATHQFRDSGARAILLMPSLLPALQALQADTQIEHVMLTGADFEALLRAGAELPVLPSVRVAQQLALLQYTGGTTGLSKGAMLTHHGLISNVVQTLELFLRPGLVEPETDIRIAPLPLYHIMAFATNCLSSVGMGLHTVFIANGRDLGQVIGAMKRHRFSLLSGINTLFVGLMNHPEFNSIDFSALRWVTSGGAPLNSEVGRRWEALTGAPIREGYGLTEASPVVTTSTSLSPHREGYIGLALVDTELRTVDDDGQDTAAEVPGELWIRGPQVMQGYWQRPEDTAQTLTADGWLKTGDIAVIDADGFVKIVDRKKDMILVSGFNVFPNEIEDAVMRHPGVREAMAIGVPDTLKGESVKLFVCRNDPALTAEALLLHCREYLTGYKVPSFVEFRDDLPKSSVGKLLRRALRE